ncbi:MAG: thioredoxin domain-containing protein [Polyangiaceae bacterium]
MPVGREHERAWLRRTGALGCAILLLAGACSSLLSTPRTATGWPAGGQIPIEADDAVFGLPSALVTAVVFVDYLEPASARALRVLESVRQEQPGTLRYVVKQRPGCGHEYSRASARAALALLTLAGPSAFWSFQEQLIAYQDRVTPAFLRAAAERAGLAAARLPALADPRFEARLERDEALASALRVDAGEPVVFVNGARLDGWISARELEAAVSRELVPVRALKARWQRDALVYEQRVQENVRGWPEPEPRERPDPALFPDPTIYAVPVGDSPSEGPPDAPVTIVELGDLGSACSKGIQPALARARARYGERVRVVFKHLTWYDDDDRAANFLEHARALRGNDGFLDARRALWEVAPNPGDADLERLALQLGLDAQDALQAVHDGRYRGRIERDLALADELGVHWEPSLFVNGRYLTDRQIDQLEPLIDEGLRVASALEAAGTARAGVYDAIIAGAPARPAQKLEPLDAPKNLPFRGDDSAPIVLQVFASYRSIACWSPRELERLRFEHPRQLKIVYWPLAAPPGDEVTDGAWRVHEAVLEAYEQIGNAGFWHMAKGICRSASLPSNDELVDYAGSIGLDVPRFRSALRDRRHRPQIEAAGIVARLYELEGQRSFIVNGQRIKGKGGDLRARLEIEKLLRAQGTTP